MHQGILKMKMQSTEISTDTCWPYLGLFNELEWLNAHHKNTM